MERKLNLPRRRPKKTITVLSLFIVLAALMCCASGSNSIGSKKNKTATILTGADQLTKYLPLLEGKKVGMLGNQTSIIGTEKKHLVDVLFNHEVDLRFAFAPEHGFRGGIERGERESKKQYRREDRFTFIYFIRRKQKTRRYYKFHRCNDF